MRIAILFLASLFASGILLDLTGCAGARRTDNAQGALVAYEREMLQAIDKEKRYPYEALDARKQGEVTIGFDYTADGKADNMEIVKSSGDANLDHSALMAVYFAKLPSRPPELDGVTRFVAVISFKFQ